MYAGGGASGALVGFLYCLSFFWSRSPSFYTCTAWAGIARLAGETVLYHKTGEIIVWLDLFIRMFCDDSPLAYTRGARLEACVGVGSCIAHFVSHSWSHGSGHLPFIGPYIAGACRILHILAFVGWAYIHGYA